MKLIDLEDGAQVVTRDYLDTKLERLQISIDGLENKFDSRLNHIEARINNLEAKINRMTWLIWIPVAASVAQIITALALGAVVILHH